MCLLRQRLALLRLHSRESTVKLVSVTSNLEFHSYSREHPNLAFDVSPFTGRLELIRQQSIKLLPHANNPLRHPLHFALPLLIQLFIAKNRISEQSTMQRRVRIHRPNHNLQLTIHPLLLLRVLGRQRKRTNTLTVQTHILSKGLRERDLVSLLDKVAHCECVAGGRARGEPLVCHVEEGEELLGSDDV
jgi:hypothetical protein